MSLKTELPLFNGVTGTGWSAFLWRVTLDSAFTEIKQPSTVADAKTLLRITVTS